MRKIRRFAGRVVRMVMLAGGLLVVMVVLDAILNEDESARPVSGA